MGIFLWIRRLFEAMGLWPNETAQKLAEINRNILANEAKLNTQQSKLQKLKRDIENTQENIFLKEKEMNSQTGKIREITEREIASQFKKFKSFSGIRDLIFRNIDSLNTVISKYKEFATALESDLDSEAIARMTGDLIEMLREVQDQDLEITKLENVVYSSTTPAIDVNMILADVHGKTQTAPQAQAQVQAQAQAEPAYVGPKFPISQPEPAPSEADVLNLEAALKNLHAETASPAPKTQEKIAE